VAHHPNVQSVYIPDAMCAELDGEARRLERSTTWLIKRAWMIARGQIKALPAPPKTADATQGGE